MCLHSIALFSHNTKINRAILYLKRQRKIERTVELEYQSRVHIVICLPMSYPLTQPKLYEYTAIFGQLENGRLGREGTVGDSKNS